MVFFVKAPDGVETEIGRATSMAGSGERDATGFEIRAAWRVRHLVHARCLRPVAPKEKLMARQNIRWHIAPPPEMWPEFVMPYYRRIYEALGEGPRSMHSELLRPGHLPFLLDLGITGFDPGNDQYLTVEDLVACDGLNFTWDLFTVRDMQRGTPGSIRSLYISCIERGATAMMTELCRGTAPANIKAFIEVARKFE